MSLFADVRVAEAVDFMVQILYNEIRYSGWRGSEHIFISANNVEGPEMTLKSIQNELEIAVQKDDEFSYRNILRKVKITCFNPDRICFLNFDLGPEHVAQYFQVLHQLSVNFKVIYCLLLFLGEDLDHSVQDD